MITPQFSLTQTETHLVITVHAPYASIKDVQIHVEDEDFRMFASPYYLRLSLPGRVEETDNSSGKYDADTGNFVITLDKVEPGQFFQGLDMITTLLQPTERAKINKPLIEVLDDGTGSSSSVSNFEVTESDWQINPLPESMVPESFGCGFGNLHHGLDTNKFEAELAEIGNMSKVNPESVSSSRRLQLKVEAEQADFSEEHYLTDLKLESDISRLVEFKFDKKSLKKLTDKNLTQMKALGNREYLLDKTEQLRLYYGLIDILFAYCYDWRITEGCHCIESCWNLSRLSATLSCFAVFSSLKDVVVNSLRRSLVYPFYRQWELSMKVFNDVLAVLKLGRTGVLICLLDEHRVFSEREPYYLLNQLYIEDYSVWIQKSSDEALTSLASVLSQCVKGISKADLNLELDELEFAANLVEDEEMEEELVADVNQITI